MGGHAIKGRAKGRAVSTSRMGRFETELLAGDESFAALTELSGARADKVHDRHPPKMIVLDMDSSVSHGRYVTFQLAEVAVPKELFRKIQRRVDDLRRRPAPA